MIFKTQEPLETSQGDTTERTAQKTIGKHKTDERQRNIPQPSAAQNDSREPRSTAQHRTDDLTRTRFPFQRRDRFIKIVFWRPKVSYRRAFSAKKHQTSTVWQIKLLQKCSQTDGFHVFRR